MGTKFELYGLYCPFTDEVKYVGITKMGLGRRLSSHVSHPTNKLMEEWIYDLKQKNTRPLIKLIKECVTYEELLNSEIEMINTLRNNNIPLLNQLDGGFSNPMLGKHHSHITKQIISEKNKGKIISETTKQKIKEKLVKLYQDNPELRLKKSLQYSGINNPFYGKSHSVESVKKLKEKARRYKGYKGQNNPNFKYDISKETLIKLFLDENKTIKELSLFFNCSKNTINKKLREYKIYKPKSNIYNLDIERILDMIDKGLNYVEIGKVFGCSNKIIHKFIKKCQIN